MPKILKTERKGFVISFEVMLTSILVCVFVSVLVYFAAVLQTKKYFANVASATCTMAARYGGNSSQAYAAQVNSGTISDNANKQIAYILSHTSRFSVLGAPDGKFISVSEEPDEAGYVHVSLQYQYEKFGWGQFADAFSPGLITQNFSVPTLINSGKLTSG